MLGIRHELGHVIHMQMEKQSIVLETATRSKVKRQQVLCNGDIGQRDDIFKAVNEIHFIRP